MFWDASPSARLETPLAIIKLQQRGSPFGSILLISFECTHTITYCWGAINDGFVLLMTSYVYVTMINYLPQT